MHKFWTIRNDVNEQAEILLYGPIADERSWYGNESSPRQFAEDLDSLGGRDVTVRINSGGGDVFAAQAIHNQLAGYRGKVTVRIDGLAASAATIVAMAGDMIIMPENALMMIHNPAVGMSDFYTADELEKVRTVLETIKSSIIAAYRKRANCTEEELTAMMDAETWLSAEDCVKYGFADEIEGTVEPVIDGHTLVVNQISFDMRTFRNISAIKAKCSTRKETTMTKLEAVLNKLGLLEEVEDAPQGRSTAEAVAAERARVEALEALDDGTPAVHAVIEAARRDGRTAEEARRYADAVKAAPTGAARLVSDMVKDNQDSGAAGIGSAPQKGDGDREAEDRRAMDRMAEVMNQKFGGKK